MRNNIYTPINLHTHKFVLCSIALDCSAQLYARFDILPARRKHFHDCIISLKGESHRWRNGAVDRGFEHRSSQTEDYKSGSCCFSAERAALRRKSKD